MTMHNVCFYGHVRTLPYYILEESNFNVRYVRLCDLNILEKMVELFANRGDTDQILHSAASDLGLHCLPITLLGGLQTTMGQYLPT